MEGISSEALAKVEGLQKQIADLNERLQPGIPQDEWDSLKASVSEHATQIEAVLTEERKRQQEDDLKSIKASVDALMRRESKAGTLGTEVPGGTKAFTGDEDPGADGKWLKALWEARTIGSPAAWEAVEEVGLKATVGDSGANGQYVIPNNFVSRVIEIAKARNIYRDLLTVIPGVRGRGVDIPYENDDSSLLRAIGQGGEVLSYGSNKDTRDFTLASASAYLFTIARIIEVGNQFLKQSEGAAEALVRSKLGRAFGLAEAHYILNGTGANNQPKGLLTSIAAASGTYTTAYSSGVRADKLAEALGVLESRNYFATAIVVNPVDYWQIVTDTQGSSGSGGYAVAPTQGASMNAGQPERGVSVWGVPLYRDPMMTAGTALMGEWSAAQLFTGDEYRIDVSDEAGNLWARNLTGFRAEEEIAFNADPYVITGMFQRVTGL
jgi:HK97 family phage major capsid protein